MSFTFSAFRNAAEYLFMELVHVESKVALIIGSQPPVDLRSFCDKICTNIANRVKSESNHTLRSLLKDKTSHASQLRAANTALKSLFRKTSRRQTSFVRFMQPTAVLFVKNFSFIFNCTFVYCAHY